VASPLQGPLWRVDHFFFAPSSAAPIAFFRIALALFAIIQIAVLSPSFLDIYGSTGYLEWIISDKLFRIQELPAVADVSNLLLRFGLSDNAAVSAVGTLYVAALVGLLIGWRTRVMAFAAWFGHLVLNNTALMFGYGVETFAHIGLFYLIWMPASERWSMDASAGRTGQRRVSGAARLSIRILQIHLCIIYLNSGIAKMMGTDWWNGEAIWRAVAQPGYSQFNMNWMAYAPWLSLLLGWFVLIVETGYPVFIWPRRTRPYWLLAILALHAGIGLFMGLWLFALVAMIFNLAAFGEVFEGFVSGIANTYSNSVFCIPHHRKTKYTSKV
jgi:hypothetical protein